MPPPPSNSRWKRPSRVHLHADLAPADIAELRRPLTSDPCPDGKVRTLLDRRRRNRVPRCGARGLNPRCGISCADASRHGGGPGDLGDGDQQPGSDGEGSATASDGHRVASSPFVRQSRTPRQRLSSRAGEAGRAFLEECGDPFLVIVGPEQLAEGCAHPFAELVPVGVEGLSEARLQCPDRQRWTSRISPASVDALVEQVVVGYDR